MVALLGAGVRTDFGPQLRLDATVSEALYVGDPRAAALNDLLQVAHRTRAVRVPVRRLPAGRWSAARRRAWWTAAWVVTAVALIGPLNTLLKEFFGRVRPDFAEGGARLESLSYPSGHSSGIATLVTVALVLAWPLMAARARHWALAVGVALVLLVGLDADVARRPLPLRRHRRLGARARLDLLTALLFGAFAEGRAALRPQRDRPEQRIVLGAGRTARSGPCCGSPTTGWRPGRATAGTRTGRSTSSPWSWPARCGTAGATSADGRR